MQADGIEVTRLAAEPALDHLTKSCRFNVAPRGVAIKTAECKRGFAFELSGFGILLAEMLVDLDKKDKGCG